MAEFWAIVDRTRNPGVSCPTYISLLTVFTQFYHVVDPLFIPSSQPPSRPLPLLPHSVPPPSPPSGLPFSLFRPLLAIPAALAIVAMLSPSLLLAIHPAKTFPWTVRQTR
jgi:hypothetical protein